MVLVRAHRVRIGAISLPISGAMAMVAVPSMNSRRSESLSILGLILSQVLSNRISSMFSMLFLSLSALFWAWESSHMSGCSRRNVFVGTPRRRTPLPSSFSSKALRIPRRTCSTELFVGANTATFIPDDMQVLMHVARTNCVFPVPGAPQTYERGLDRTLRTAFLCC